MATEIKRVVLKGPRVIPPRLTTKSSTDLLPLEMRLGTSKEAQPAAILKKKQKQRLDIAEHPPSRRKSATDIDACARTRPPAQVQTEDNRPSLLYAHCQLNENEALALIDTGRVDSVIPRGLGEAYGVIPTGSSTVTNNHVEETNSTKYPEIQTDDIRVAAQLRLGSEPVECHLTVVPDDSLVLLTIGMDILHTSKCILDVASRVLYLDDLSGEAIPLLTHEEVYGDSRLVRSQSSTL